VSNQPALSLLLIVGLIQFWLMPTVAWILLKGQRDVAARFWFAGTACYAGTASLFVLQTLLPKVAYLMIGFVLVTMMLALIAESLRRELSSTPTPWGWILSVVIGNAVLLVVLQHLIGDHWMRVVQLAIVSALDLGCCYLLLKVIRAKHSRALAIVLVGFLAVVVTNLLRIHGFFVRGEPPLLLNYTLTSNLGFIANYLAVVVYSFGYWGFVIEKNRAALLAESAERTRAQQGESQAIDRERTSLELVRQREALIAELARMQRAAQAGALSASIAHEINQPLASVRLSIEEAIELLLNGSNPPRLAMLLRRISDENQRAATIIRTLRDVFRGYSGQIETRAVDEVVEATLGLLRRRAIDLGVEVRVELQAPARLKAGAGELDHVILNLLSNALDAVAELEGIRREVFVSTWVEPEVICIRIRDTGPGIDQSVRDQLFDLFASKRAGGLGLGLWLSRYIVERHGGEIGLETIEGLTGASFLVRLPRAVGTE
jgi:signal transduction histidine kinase